MSDKRDSIKKKDFMIMVVDDDDLIVDEDSDLLKKEGYNVISALNGRDAIETIKNQDVDVLVLDYFMPGFTGEQVVEEIRKFNKEIVILLQTGYSGKKPPIEMLEMLDIQGYHDKNEGTDKLLLWVASAVRSSAQMRANKNMREGLISILNSIPKIFRRQVFTKLLDEILIGISDLIKYQSGFVVVEDYNDEGTIAYGNGRFQGYTYQRFTKESIGTEIIAAARKEKDTVLSGDVLAVPLMDDDKWLGVVYIENCEIKNEESINLIKLYENQAVEAIVNIQLHEEIRLANEKLKDSYARLKRTYFELIEALTKAVEARDRYTAGHSARVSLYSRLIGRAIGFSKEELAKLKISALFHDIGKIGIPDFVLLKVGKLNDEEYSFIKEHPNIGSKILSPVETLAEAIPAVKYHHEKYNGGGYPDGISKEDIPLHARILAIADSFDAMTSDRTYKQKKTYEQALEELEKCAGTQFDPELTKHFINEFRNNIKFMKRLINFWDHVNRIDGSTWSYTDPYGFVHYGYCFEKIAATKIEAE